MGVVFFNEPLDTGAAAFTPASLTTCISWFVWNQGTTLVSGRIQAWADQKGSNNLSQATASKRPFFDTSGGGNNAGHLRFGASTIGNQVLTGSGIVAVDALWCVLRWNYPGVSGTQQLVGLGCEVDSGTQTASTMTEVIDNSASTLASVGIPTGTDGTLYAFDPGGVTASKLAWQNGAPGFDTGDGSTNFGHGASFTLGDASGLGAAISGWVYELALFNTVGAGLSSTDLSKLQTYAHTAYLL